MSRDARKSVSLASDPVRIRAGPALGLQLTITLTNEIVDRYAKRRLKILALAKLA
jgi:hypothetical protein